MTQHNLLGSGMKTIKAIGVGAGGRATGKSASTPCQQFTLENHLLCFEDGGRHGDQPALGNIGQLIAGKFKLFLDYTHTRIILEPNSTFSQPMDRATAGVVLTTEGKDYATIRISDVLENSPASEAGIQKNDIVLSVDGKPAAELKALKIAEMFEKPATYKLTLRRGEQTLQVPLTPRKLI